MISQICRSFFPPRQEIRAQNWANFHFRCGGFWGSVKKNLRWRITLKLPNESNYFNKRGTEAREIKI